MEKRRIKKTTNRYGNETFYPQTLVTKKRFFSREIYQQWETLESHSEHGTSILSAETEEKARLFFDWRDGILEKVEIIEV